MKRNIIISLIFFVFFTTGFPFFVKGNLTSVAFADNIIFVCHPGVSKSTLNKNEIKNIFLGKKTEWEDHKKIVFVVLKEGKTHETLLKKYVGKTIFQYLNYWKKQVFTGKGKPPKSFETEDKLIEFILNTEGSIGYISAGTDKKSAKIILLH